MKALALLAPILLLASCAGYQLGGTKPKPLANVRSIAVPMFENGTLQPRAEALATTAVTNALTLDGTYKIARTDRADAVLKGKLTSIQYSPLTANRFDTLRPEELHSTVRLEWNLLDAKDPTKVLMSGTSIGQSNFFVDSNLQTARTNALPDALQKAGEVLVSRLANGY
ncbi:MAG: LPS assembly lipoprotein LptE [Luteolibacter sp.]